MDRIRTFIAIARRRLLMEAWLAAALKAGVFAFAILLLLVVERRITAGTGYLGLPSGQDGIVAWAMVGAAALAVAAGYGVWRARRAVRSETSAALELDARLESGERFTSALELEGNSDPFARAAVADAVQYAAAPAVASAVNERFKVTPPQRWWIAPSILAAALAAWIALPQYSLFGAPEPKDKLAADAPTDAPTPEKDSLVAMVKAIEKSPELSKALKAELDQAKHALDPGADNRKPEEQAREALRRQAELQQRLEEMKNTDEAKASEAMKDALAKLEMPEGKNPATDFAEALKRGDFADAKKALSELKAAIKDDKLTQEQRDALSKALDKTAKQLEQMSKDPQKLQEALKSAGMDPDLAKNAQALQQAIQQSQSLNQTQKQQLQQMQQSLQKSQSQLNQMSQQMNQMSSACQNPGQNPGQKQSQSQQGQNGGQQGQQQQSAQSGQSGDQMSDMLSEAEAAETMQRACENAQSQSQCNSMSQSECDSVLKSSCRGGDCNKPGNSDGNKMKEENKGGRGVASGGGRDIKETKYGTKIQHTKGSRSEGDVIARQLVEGQSPVGESHVQLQQVAGEIAPGYEDGTDDEPIPAHQSEIHKQYFGKLRKQIEDRGVKVPAAAPAGAPAAAPKAAPAGGSK